MRPLLHRDYFKATLYLVAVVALWIVLWQVLEGPWFPAILVAAGVVELTWRLSEARLGTRR